jgi:Zn-dependent protease
MRSIISRFAFVLAIWAIVCLFSGAPSLLNAVQVAGCMLLAFFLWWFGVCAHEIGHAFCAGAVGFDVRRIGIGPIAIEWRDGKTKVRRDRGHQGFSGYVSLASSASLQRSWRRSFCFFIAGGPLAQAMYGFALFGIATLASSTSPTLHAVLVFAAVLQLLVTLTNVIPARIGTSKNDGYQLRMVLRGRRSADALRQMYRWTEFLLSSGRPAEWPTAMVAELETALLQAGEESPEEIDLAISAGYYLYLYHADRRDWGKASLTLNHAVELPRPQRKAKGSGRFDLVDLLSAIHLALRGRNPLAAIAAFQRVDRRSPIHKNSLAIGAMASIDLAAGNDQKALNLANRAMEMLRKSGSNVGADRLQKSWWNEIICSKPIPESAPRDEPVKAPRTSHKDVSFTPRQPVIASASQAPDCFAWDPGVPSDLRTRWILRQSGVAQV